MARKLKGGAIQSNTITITQIQTTAVTNIITQTGPRVTSLVYPGNDTAANTVGGQTVYINGSGFEVNNAIYINGNAVPSKSFISASNISFTTPALSAGIYPVYLINTDSGATAIFVPGIIASAEPTWVTSAGSLNASQDEGSAWSYSLSATGDAPITYALADGSSLPTGISLAANGLISGTISSPTGNATTYTFSVVATDAQNQDSTRQFTVTTSTSEGVLFANNVLLIHADGTNNQNNHHFLDSSNNNFTITRYGNATQGTFSPFSQTGWSNYFDGSGDYLSVPDSTAYDFGTGDFTIEAWIYPTTSSGVRILVGQYSGSDGFSLELTNSNTLTLWLEGATIATSTGTVTTNAWNHVSACRSGSSLKLFINGVVDGSATNSTNVSGSTSSLYISSSASTPGAGVFTGYISNLRIVKGTAVYTSAFTPPTSPLTAISGTSLLTCQSNRFIDNSTNAFTLTLAGDVSVLPFSPFAPTAAYSTANVGGSAYFDGTGDYLSLASNEVFNVGTGDFTLECYYYHVAGGSALYPSIFSSTDWSGGGVGLRFNNTGYANKFAFFWNGVGDPWLASSATYAPFQWNHVALTRSGTSFTLWVNGQSAATGTNSGAINFNYNGGGPRIGWGPWDGSNGYLKGIISDLRLIKGTALYSSSFTPPTAPLTSVANTSLLCNFTNAGIFDQTAKNVIETVGDAKISTAQYKYGSGSMAFDGTGDYLTIPNSPLYDFGTGDFTIEMWIYFNAFSDGKAILTKGWSTINAPFLLYTDGTQNKVKFYSSSNGSTWGIADGIAVLNSPSTGQWYHIAVTRSGNTFRTFANGTETANLTSSAALYSTTQPVTIGSGTGATSINAYIDDLRITKGYARYTANFTPPTSAFKDK